MEQCFRLYTWQNPDWDIEKEKRDPSKGRQRWRDKWDELQQLYPKLKKKVGTLDFVWCYAEYVHWKQLDISRLWVFDVPSSKIFQFLDSDIWNTMLQNVNNNKQPEDICWNQLIVERSEGIKRLSAESNADITPLVLVPLCPLILVIDKSKFNKGPKFADASARYEDLPTSECEAKRCHDEGPKRGAWRQR